MIANEARKIANHAIHQPALQAWIDDVHAKIKAAAEAGEFSVKDPHTGFIGATPAFERSVWIALISEGYNVQHFQDPDPGHPCSRPYTVVSW